MTPRQFVEKIIGTFGSELAYYTHPDVQTTAHQVGTPFKDSWTTLLCEIGTIQRPEFIERYTELERTLSSLYCFELNKEEKTYSAFTEAQNATPDDKLSQENYALLCADISKTLQNNQDSSQVLACLVTYSDLGKSPATRALAKSAGIDSTLDTDDLMLEILKLDDAEVIKILPSFAKLSPSAKQTLRTAYPIMTACFGHLYFLEGGPKTLETIAKALQGIEPAKRKELLDLVFLAQFYDGVGSQGQLNMAGSVTCTNNFYKGYWLMRATLHDLERRLTASDNVEQSVLESIEPYLLERARWINLDAGLFRKKEDFEFVLRLACTIRIFTPEFAQTLVAAFYKLDTTHQNLLTEQLSFNSKKGINSFARTPHYVATAAQNISREAFSKKEISRAIEKALDAEICLAMLIKQVTEKHPGPAANTRIPMSFGKLAFRATEPGFWDPQTFDATLARWALPRPQPKSTVKNLVFSWDSLFNTASPQEIHQRLAYLDELINEGYNLYLINNNKNQLDGIPLGKYFFKQYYSEPNAATFSQILKENQLKPKETVFFDSTKKQVNAAWEYGILGRQFSAQRPITDIKLILDAITQNHQSGQDVSRISTLTFFTAAKFNRLRETKQESETNGLTASTMSEQKQYPK